VTIPPGTAAKNAASYLRSLADALAAVKEREKSERLEVLHALDGMDGGKR
jgi:hypothetical protein